MKLKGIGEKRIKELNNHNINDIKKLLSYYPSKYYDFSDINNFDPNSKNVQSLHVKCTGVANNSYFKNLSCIKIPMQDIKSKNNLLAVWYNQPYIKKYIEKGNEYLLYGKMSPTKFGEFIVQSVKTFDRDLLKPLPVYKPIGSVKSSNLQTAIKEVLSKYNIESVIDENIEKKYNLVTLKQGYEFIHCPDKKEDILIGKKRIDIETYLKLLSIKNKLNVKIKKDTKYIDYKNIYEEFKNQIDFTLTQEQENVIKEICGDMSSGYVMNRLLQGDVGSGKTIVAFFVMYLTAKSGYQSLMMAPTEILARQHYERAQRLFSKLNISVSIITAKMQQKIKKDIINDLKIGKIQILFGTHSILNNDVEFQNLRLAITDEQHRFGVEQRNNLNTKSQYIDTLVMSATPIPRSLALTLYGDLNISTIINKPYKNSERFTHLYPQKQEQKLYDYISNEIKKGEKVYIVCPAIFDENMQNDISNIEKIAKNLLKYEEIAKNITILHGKQNKKSQEQSLALFISGEKPILLSTTIIEVGVDVKDANTMIIYNPERFGLATLHQLRGRIGRGEKNSHCFCILKDKLEQSSLNRLEFFAKHNNGFEVAEYDFKNRGPGNILGTHQHGKVELGITFDLSYDNFNLSKQIFKDINSNHDGVEKIFDLAKEEYCDILDKVVLN